MIFNSIIYPKIVKDVIVSDKEGKCVGIGTLVRSATSNAPADTYYTVFYHKDDEIVTYRGSDGYKISKATIDNICKHRIVTWICIDKTAFTTAQYERLMQYLSERTNITNIDLTRTGFWKNEFYIRIADGIITHIQTQKPSEYSKVFTYNITPFDNKPSELFDVVNLTLIPKQYDSQKISTIQHNLITLDKDNIFDYIYKPFSFDKLAMIAYKRAALDASFKVEPQPKLEDYGVSEYSAKTSILPESTNFTINLFPSRCNGKTAICNSIALIQEENKMTNDINFRTEKGFRYVSEGKHKGKEIPTITTYVSLNYYPAHITLTGTATIDADRYDERQGILEALANLVYGNFENKYTRYTKNKKKADIANRTCPICGTIYNTAEEATKCVEAHKERKIAKKKAYKIRKEAMTKFEQFKHDTEVSEAYNALVTEYLKAQADKATATNNISESAVETVTETANTDEAITNVAEVSNTDNTVTD